MASQLSQVLIVSYEFKAFLHPRSETLLHGLVPTLFVGLGGTGKDVLMRLRKRLCDRSGLCRRSYMRFLMLDTDMNRWWPGDARPEEYEPVRPEAGETVSCQITDTRFYHAFELLERQDPRFTGWLKPELRNLGPQAVAVGAGGQRQFGRLGFMLNYDEIRRQMESHLRDMQADIGSEIATQSMGVSIEEAALEIVIVTSLAGGTGAGMLFDVAYLMKDILESREKLANLRGHCVTVYAVMPAVFRDVMHGRMFAKLQQNAYAALLEMEHYGAARTGDELFVGRIDQATQEDMLGFTAPWKNNALLVGRGWDVCYLIDNANVYRPTKPLPPGETYQMIADFLALDFQHSQFACAKRSRRWSLRERQHDALVLQVRRNPADRESQSPASGSRTDVMYAKQFGCTFCSFGLAQISFGREKVYRAAGYLLAAKLIDEHWLGQQGTTPESDFQQYCREDFYEPRDELSFAPYHLVPWLYRTYDRPSTANLLNAALQECRELGYRNIVEGCHRLDILMAKHRAALRSAPDAGPAFIRLRENGECLLLRPGSLPALHQRVRTAARRRANRLGVAVVHELLDHYRRETHRVSQYRSPHIEGVPRSAANELARLAAAESLPFPARSIARRIEFPRARQAVEAEILKSYSRSAAPFIERIMREVREYIGEQGHHRPKVLDQHGTLYDYFDNASQHLRSVRNALLSRFDTIWRDTGTDCDRLLAPRVMGVSDLRECITRALVSSPLLGDFSGSEFSWERLDELVFEKLHANNRYSEGGAYVSSLTDLLDHLDHWFSRYHNDQQAAGPIAEDLGSVCAAILMRIGLDLSRYGDGSVIDLLQTRFQPNERNSLLETFVRSSAAYLPLASKVDREAGYRPSVEKLIGWKPGTDPWSAQFEADLVGNLQRITDALAGNAGMVDPPVEDAGSLVLCEEISRVPVQAIYALESLRDAYFDSQRTGEVDECHIQSHECWSELPDIVFPCPETCHRLGESAKDVALAMMTGAIIANADGSYRIRMPCSVSGSPDKHRLPKQISRIVETVAENEGMRGYLEHARQRWEAELAPKNLALVYASARQTYEATQTEDRPEAGAEPSPLNNCAASLLEQLERRLQATDEGQRWLALLKHTEQNTTASTPQKDFLAELIRRQVLVPLSPAGPIYSVNWREAEQLRLSDWPVDPDAVLGPPIVRRHTDVSFPEEVPVGKPSDLRIQFVPAEQTLPDGRVQELPKPHEHDVTVPLQVPEPLAPAEPPPPIRVRVNVVAENFTIAGSTRAEIIVPLTGKSAPVYFTLRGSRIGPGRIVVDFDQSGRHVGSVELRPRVAAADAAESESRAPARGEVQPTSRPGPPPDAVIKVFEFRLADRPGRLHFVFSSADARLKDLPMAMEGDLGTVDLHADVAAWVEGQLSRIGQVARRSDATSEDVNRKLRDVGYSLFDQLLPPGLKELCWTLRQRGIRRLLILSDEPHIPWELVKPYRRNAITAEFEDEAPFWGETYALTRWLRGRTPPDHLSLRRAVTMTAAGAGGIGAEPLATRDLVPAPGSDSAKLTDMLHVAADTLLAEDEEHAVSRRLTSCGARVRSLSPRRRTLEELFETGDFDLLHLVSHGGFGGAELADASAVMMDDGPFCAMDLSPGIEAALRAAGPLIFFNACHSGRLGFSLTRLGSWGARLVQLGCGGFVGALWPVTEQAAPVFANTFYESLGDGKSIAEAVLAARQATRESFPADPTWLAYCCYADPLARVVVDLSSTS